MATDPKYATYTPGVRPYNRPVGLGKQPRYALNARSQSFSKNFSPTTQEQVNARAEVSNQQLQSRNAKWQKVYDATNAVTPYISNIANAFRRMPRPIAPKSISAVSPTQISYAAEVEEVDSSIRAANRSAERNLDENTAAAVKAANMATAIREKGRITQGEKNTNAQLRARTAELNAGIEAQNVGAYNQYQNDKVQGMIAQQVNQSANLSNAVDKYIAGKNEQAKANLDERKWRVLSRMFKDSGVADRLMEDLQTDMKAYGGPLKTGGGGGGKKLAGRETGGMEKGDKYYETNARLAFYKQQLNDKLKAKNPQGFQDFFKGLAPLRANPDPKAQIDYVQNSKYNDYLSPEEVRQTLGKEYDNYISSLQFVNAHDVANGRQPLFGELEGENDVTKLNYGRRFASLGVTPTFSASNESGTRRYNRTYTYDPVTQQVDFTEEGDQELRPSTLRAASGQVVKRKMGGKLQKVF